MWPEQPLQNHGELDTGTRVGGAELLLYCDAENSSKHPKLLMNRRRLQQSDFDHSRSPPHASALLEAVSKVCLNPRRVDFRELHRSEHRAKGLEGVVVHFVRLLCANRRLRVVLDKKVIECKLLALTDCGERVVVSGVQPFAQLPLRVLPVFCMRRFQTAATGTVPIAHPPDLAVIASIYNSVMLTRSCQIPPPV